MTGLTGTTHTVTGLSNGTTYYFVVRAENSLGQKSAPSAQASAIPLAMPTGFTLTAGDTQTTASWSAASGASTYTLYYSESSLTAVTDLDTQTGVTRVPSITGTTRTVTGLTNGTRYYFRVKAVNAGGRSAPSAQASAIPLATPTGFTLTAGDAQATASWSAASGASSYTLYHATTPLAGATDLDTRASGITRLTGLTSTWLTVTGLSNGTTYYFVVRAENSLGQKGAPSAQASAIPLATPTGFTLTAGDTQATASWSAASGASSYTLYYSESSLTAVPHLLDTRASGITRLTGLTGTSRTVTGLTNGTRYYFRVKAVNAGGAVRYRPRPPLSRSPRQPASALPRATRK